jgi:integrase
VSIYQRHDHPNCPPMVDGARPAHRCRGHWVATIAYGRRPDGRRDRKAIYGATKGEVTEKLRQASRKAPKQRSGKTHTVESWLDEWLSEHKWKLKPQTRVGYQAKIDAYIVPLIGTKRLDRLEAVDIDRMLTRLRRPCPSLTPEGRCPHKPSHGLSEATARHVYIIIKDALKIAARHRHIPENVALDVDPPETKQNMRALLTTPLADQVIAHAATLGPERHLRALIALEQALRPGEALGLWWGVIDLDGGSLTVCRTLEGTGNIGTPKSEASNRTIPMTTRTWAAARAYYAHLVAEGREPAPTDRVFGGSLDHDRRRWRTLLEGAGVPVVTLYSARQSAARRLEESGVVARAAAQFMGHSNVNMTYRYQRGADVETLRKAIGA